METQVGKLRKDQRKLKQEMNAKMDALLAHFNITVDTRNPDVEPIEVALQ